MEIALPIILTMLLGRAIDLRTYRVSTNIYDDAEYEKVEDAKLNARYFVGDSAEAVYDRLGVPADLALYIKADVISFDEGVNGLDAFITETIWEENTVLIPIVTSYQTETHNISKRAEILENGKQAALVAGSTHFASHIVYGGWMIFVYKFKTDHPLDSKLIKTEIINLIGEEGDVDENFVDLWRSVEAKIDGLTLRGPVRLEYWMYSSVPYSINFTNPVSMKRVIDKFPDEVRKIGGGIGQPLMMFLYPLQKIDSKFDNVSLSRLHQADIVKLNKMFDDLKDTRDLTSTWTSTLLELTPDEEQEIAKLLDSVESVIKLFYELIPKISLYKTLDKKLFEPVFQAYNESLPIPGGTYHLAYRRLKESIGTVCQDEFHPRVLGQLRLSQDEMSDPVDTSLTDCQNECVKNNRCRAISFAEKLSVLDRETGLWEIVENRCWILYRSTSTAPFEASSELIGDVYIYDRKCN